MVPRFLDGEVVRIAGLDDTWADEHQWVINQEGVVASLQGANRTGTGWEYSVWIEEPEARALWLFDDDEIESLGYIELDSGERVQRDDSHSRDELHDEVYLELDTAVTDEAEAKRVARAAEEILLSIASPHTVTVELDARPCQEPHEFRIRMTVAAPEEGLEAFDAIVATCESGWTGKADDGWRCDFYWSQPDHGPEAVFLVPEAKHVWIGVHPWDNPTRRSRADLRVPAS